ncbi:MAG: nitrite reductase large subunit NirB [Acidimicrobiia bacterium]
MGTDRTILVVGHGMVGHRFLEAAVEAGLHLAHHIVVVGEEPRPAYDRVHLSSLFDGMSADDLRLGSPTFAAEHGIEVRSNEVVVALDTAGRRATTSAGAVLLYHECVLATGSYPFVPPVPGIEAAGSFVYRTIEDLDAIRAWSTGCRTGVVVGGGLLGLEAANALRLLGLDTTVVEFAPRLMAVQLDDGGGRALRRHVEALGLHVITSAGASAVLTTPDGRVEGLRFAETCDRPDLAADIVVFAAGIRPRDELARQAGLEVGERGGVVIDDRGATSAAGVWAIGEVAAHAGRCYGLVAPGYKMAEVVADRLAGGTATFEGADTSTTLKLLGVDVAVAGDPHGAGDEVVFADPVAGVYKKLVLGPDGAITGAVLVGDVSAYPALVQYCRGTLASPAAPAALVAPAGSGVALPGPADLPDEATICSCHNVTCGAIRSAVSAGAETPVAVGAATKAGTGCGSCVPLVSEMVDAGLAAAGRTVIVRLCEHFAMSRQELFDVVRVTGIRTFAELVGRHGNGRGCAICKPAVASMFASLASGHVLDGEQASLQDTNDHFLANLQRDGTYSVVPRVPAGEITPDGLIAIGEIARDFDLYTKITGGQRIDMFGARVEQLPEIWRRLIGAGFESGHAYGKALRTVKSCVGSTWCRFGVQDSVQLAIDLELRYRGLRAPHKIKLAASGCARECAEAQSKDVGVIATERGWNLYVGGNGGMRPVHAQLLAEDLDTETLFRFVDRFLAYYIRTADRLERTATWLRKLPGGVAQVKRVVVDDALGIGADLEADIARHVESYECEWKATLDDPMRLARFATFVNSDEGDPTLAYVRVRGQRQPVEIVGARP